MHKIAMVQHIRERFGDISDKLLSFPETLTSMQWLPDISAGMRCRLTLCESGEGDDGKVQMMRIVKLRPSRGKHLDPIAAATDVGVVLHDFVCFWRETGDMVVTAKPMGRSSGLGAAMLDLVGTEVPSETLKTRMGQRGLQEVLYGFKQIVTAEHLCEAISFTTALVRAGAFPDTLVQEGIGAHPVMVKVRDSLLKEEEIEIVRAKERERERERERGFPVLFVPVLSGYVVKRLLQPCRSESHVVSESQLGRRCIAVRVRFRQGSCSMAFACVARAWVCQYVTVLQCLSTCVRPWVHACLRAAAQRSALLASQCACVLKLICCEVCLERDLVNGSQDFGYTLTRKGVEKLQVFWRVKALTSPLMVGDLLEERMFWGLLPLALNSWKHSAVADSHGNACHQARLPGRDFLHTTWGVRSGSTLSGTRLGL